ncbi:hypothetical protein J2S43_007279 [Catenuloplanes nepalensis]|uniref:Uncharacterized protein n=1 Tax=Catenuloplanes nepalensis TaxID=587533 RepID=A0ABT9N507_9ACTN|nr:hypothetical protein [Catenuloplanes nepalensis]MDP9798767.1 hypothetical protein [Catenuloplanes nepalensis]
MVAFEIREISAFSMMSMRSYLTLVLCIWAVSVLVVPISTGIILTILVVMGLALEMIATRARRYGRPPRGSRFALTFAGMMVLAGVLGAPMWLPPQEMRIAERPVPVVGYVISETGESVTIFDAASGAVVAYKASSVDSRRVCRIDQDTLFFSGNSWLTRRSLLSYASDIFAFPRPQTSACSQL